MECGRSRTPEPECGTWTPGLSDRAGGATSPGSGAGDAGACSPPAILAQQGAPAKLASLVRKARLQPDVAKSAIRLAQAAPRPNAALIDALRTAGGLDAAGWKLTPELSSSIVDLVAKQGDPVQGEAIYRQADLQCIKCHAIGGSGGKVGPDLVSIGASAPIDYLIEALLDPNAKVKENYHSQILETDSGELFTGIVVSHADGLWTLRQANDELVRIPDEEVIDESEGTSLMPEGVVDGLTQEELVHLVTFLSRLGKVGDYAIGNRRFVRSWQSLTWTQAAHRRLNRTSFDTAATDDESLQWQSEYSQVSGELPIDSLAEYKIHANTAPTNFVKFKIQVTTAGNVRLDFGDATGLSLWVDSKPTPIQASFEAELTEGTHEFVLAIDREARQSSLKIELQDASSSPATFQAILDP